MIMQKFGKCSGNRQKSIESYSTVCRYLMLSTKIPYDPIALLSEKVENRVFCI